MTPISFHVTFRNTDFRSRAGIGFAPNGMRAIDAIEPRFRALYEKICVGNKRSDAQHVFFEGMLLEKGLGGSKDRTICAK